MRKDMFVWLLLALLALAMPVQAVADISINIDVPANSYNYCVNDNLHSNMTITKNNETYNITTVRKCSYGCQNGMCINENTDMNLIYIIGLLGIAGILSYISFNLDKQAYGYLQVFFFLLALIMILATSFILYYTTEMIAQTGLSNIFTIVLSIFMAVVTFNVFYFIIQLIKNLLIKLGALDKEDEDA